MVRNSTRLWPNRLPINILFALFVTTSLLASGSVSVRPAYADDKGTEGTSTDLETSASSCSIRFADVGGADYFYESVQYLYCKGAIGGYGDNTFRPYDATSRGQLSKIIVLSTGLPINTNGGPHFSDVPPNSPFYGYVETAYSRGFISGYGDGTFRPNTNVSRAQLAKVVVMAEGWPLVKPSTSTFNDVPTNSVYFPFVETAVQRGVISGYGNRTFGPSDPATRGQICKIIYVANVPTVPSNLTTQEQQTINLINQRRSSMGLRTLRVSSALTNAARRHSNDVGPKGLCQHNGTDRSSPWDRIAQAGYTGSAMGEVVGCNYNSPRSVVDGWWNSSGHYSILTKPDATEIGCGWWIGQNGYGWQTCDTGR